MTVFFFFFLMYALFSSSMWPFRDKQKTFNNVILKYLTYILAFLSLGPTMQYAQFKEERFDLARGYRAFSQWLAGFKAER